VVGEHSNLNNLTKSGIVGTATDKVVYQTIYLYVEQSKRSARRSMAKSNRSSVVKSRRRRQKQQRAEPLAKRQKKVEAETEKAGQAIQQWQGAWVGEQEDLPNEDEDDWKMVAIDDVRFNKHEPDASTLDAKWQRKVQVNGQSRIVTKCEPIKIGDVISCPTWGPRAHRYASPQVVASDWLLLQIVP
jgi:hypothetical protein